jgi:nucleotide-binding universal stress UspA family protein
VHVVEDEWGMAGGDFARAATVAGEELLQRAAERARSLGPAVDVSAHILHGSPVGELAAACAPDDLLVIGTHKTGFLHGRVLGSRSVSIASLASCSVAVIPDGHSSSRHGVVVGVVGPAGTFHAVISAAREASRLRQALTLVHASPPRVGNGIDAGFARERQRQLLRHAAEVASEAAPQVAVHTRVSSRRPAEALLDASHEATMLVLEPSRERDVAASIVGSTTHDVLMNINAPVLISRGDHF